MANINLSTNQSGKSTRKPPSIETGIIIMLVILLSVVAVSAFLFVRANILSKDVVSVQSTYDRKIAGLSGGERNMDVIDLQNRIFTLQDLIDRRSFSLDAIQNLEKNLVAGVAADSISIDSAGKKIVLKLTADNHDIVARQIASFKGFEYFSDVVLADTKQDNAGKVEFDVNIIGK